MREHPIVQLLKDLNVNLEAGGHEHYKYVNKPWMDLTIETWKDEYDGELVVSICHYGEQNGDLMRDPEVVFRLVRANFGLASANDNPFNWIVQPMSYRNDYVGIDQTIREVRSEKVNGTVVSQVWINRKAHESVKSFLKTWVSNIRGQGFTREKLVIPQ